MNGNNNGRAGPTRKASAPPLMPPPPPAPTGNSAKAAKANVGVDVKNPVPPPISTTTAANTATAEKAKAKAQVATAGLVGQKRRSDSADQDQILRQKAHEVFSGGGRGVGKVWGECLDVLWMDQGGT